MNNSETMKKEGDGRTVITTDSRRIPLRERRNDIIPLALRLMREAEDKLKTSPKQLSGEAEEYLLNRSWPGDEDELETAVKRACILAERDILEVEDFDFRQRRIKSVGTFIEERLRGFMRNIKTLEKFNLYEMVIPEVERSLILMVLKETGGNQLWASRLLGINRNTLRSKMRKLGIRHRR